MAKDAFIGINKGDTMFAAVAQGTTPGKELEISYDKTVFTKAEAYVMIVQLLEFIIQNPDPK